MLYSEIIATNESKIIKWILNKTDNVRIVTVRRVR